MRLTRQSSNVALCALSMCAAFSAGAAQPGSAASAEDREFLVKAARVSRQEVLDAARVAQSAATPALKQAARQIASEHSQVRNRVDALARVRGVSLADESTGDTGGVLRDGGSEDADAVRIATLLQSHEDAVALFHQEAVRGMDPEVQRLAATMLPTLQRRLQTLRELQAAHPILQT